MQAIAVPVKLLTRAKSRLSPVLTREERARLSLAMLQDVLEACLAQDGWNTSVISPDPVVLELAARRGARGIAETGRSLGAAVRQVEALAGPGRASRLAVVLGDLPFLTRGALAEALSAEAPVVAAPAASDGGTNLLVRRPPQVIPARFGSASFAKHRWAAGRAGVAFETAGASELAFDLDRPQDLRTLLTSGRGGRTVRACLEMGLAATLQGRA